MISLNLTNQQAKSVLNVNDIRRNEIKNCLLQLQKELTEIDSMDEQIKTQLDKSESKSKLSNLNGYKPEWKMPQKISYVLEKENKQLTTKAIADTIYGYEPKLERSRLVRNISSVLITGSGKRYKKEKNERNENVFTLMK